MNDDDVNPFKPKPSPDEIHDRVDEALRSLESSDKIQLMNDIKTTPPKPDSLKTVIKPGSYAVDLRTLLAAQISDCPATVIPMLIDHGVRTAVDIKETYKPEKRYMSFEYKWILWLILGLGIGLVVLSFLFGWI